MPKKKGTKKGGKIVDGVATNEMTRQQLMGHVKRMQIELNREREERSFYMLEREKLYALWQITLEKLEAAKTEVRVADAKMDDHELERDREMQIYKQKLRFLMTEQSKRVAETRLQSLKRMRSLHFANDQVQDSLRQTLERKNHQITAYQSSVHTMMREILLQHAKEQSKLRMNFCEELRKIESNFERKIHEKEKLSDIEQNEEIIRMNQEKSEHIQRLVDIHDHQLKEMKHFFNEITANNFAVISCLQEELEMMRKKERRLEREVEKWQRGCGALEQALLKEKETTESHLLQDRKSAGQLKIRLNQVDRRMKRNDHYARILEVNNEALLQKAEVVEREREVWHQAYAQSLLELQKKSNMRILMLEGKMKEDKEDDTKLEKKDGKVAIIGEHQVGQRLDSGESDSQEED